MCAPDVGFNHANNVDEMKQKIDGFPAVQEFRQERMQSPDDIEKFKELVDFAVKQARYHGVEPKVIRGYTGQPAGYNGVPQIIFGKINEGGNLKPRTRILSIPMPGNANTPVTIIIDPGRKGPRVDEKSVAYGGNRFRPTDLDDFLENPGHYFA